MITIVHILACTRPPPANVQSPARFDEPGPAVTVELFGVSGPDATVWVRWVDEDGATVEGDPVEIVVDGTPVLLPIAADGYGRLPLAQPGLHTVEFEGRLLQIETGPTVALPLPEGWLGANLPAVPRGDLTRGGAGLLFLDGEALWWFDRRGLFHRVLAPPSPVIGVAPGHIDQDGIPDAVAWTADAVHLLQGRPEGGMRHLGRIVATGRRVVGAAVGDVDDDGWADVAIAWEGGPHAGQVDLWRGDGRGLFGAPASRWMTDTPAAVMVGAPRRGASDQITVLTADGSWNRFYPWNDGLARAGPALLLDLPTGSAHRLGDMLGDGGDEILALSAPTDDERRIQIVDLQDVPRIITLDRGRGHPFLADLDADGRDDFLFVSEAGRISRTYVGEQPEMLEVRSLLAEGVLAGGPLGVLPTGEMVVAGEQRWSWLPTRVEPDRTATVELPGLEAVGIAVRDGRFALLPGPYIVGVSTTFDQLRVWDAHGALASYVPLTEADLVDLALCDDRAYLLTAGSLRVVDLADPGDPRLLPWEGPGGVAVACGEGPEAARLAVLDGTRILTFDEALTELETIPTSASSLALAGGALFTCDQAGCTVLGGPFGPHGEPLEVVAGPGTLTVGGIPQPGGGVPSIADVDGDRRPDLILQEQGTIVLYRASAVGLLPPRLWWSRETLVGPVRFADFDGDGQADPVVAASDGRLLVARSAPAIPADDPDDTGLTDTAAPP